MTVGEYLHCTGWYGALLLASFPIAVYQVLTWIGDWLYPIEEPTP